MSETLMVFLNNEENLLERNFDVTANLSPTQRFGGGDRLNTPKEVYIGVLKRTKVPTRDVLKDLSWRRIELEEILFLEKISCAGGAYADVAFATLVTTGRDKAGRKVAVKKLRFVINSNTDEEKFLRMFVNELRVLDGLSHPNIIELIGFVEDIKNRIAWIVLPWEENGNLREFLHSEKWEIPERVSLIRDVTLGLEYLHTRQPPVYHGDLKSLNILVNSSNRAIIIDFGSARHMVRGVRDAGSNPGCPPPSASHADPMEQNKRAGFTVTVCPATLTLTGPACSLRWAPPEVLNGEPLNLASDIWALGWIGWEAMTDCYPFEGLDLDLDVTMKMVEGQLPRIYDHHDLSKIHSLCSLMQKCWRLDPEQRPSATECRKTIRWIPHIVPGTKGEERSQARSTTLLLEIGENHRLQSRHEDASRVFERGLVIAQSTGDRKAVADLLVRLGDNHGAQSKYTQAEASYVHALAIYMDLSNSVQPRAPGIGSGYVHPALFKCLEAERFSTKALAPCESAGENRNKKRAWEESTDGITPCAEALTSSKSIGHVLSQVNTWAKAGYARQAPSFDAKTEAAFARGWVLAMRKNNRGDGLPGLGYPHVEHSNHAKAGLSCNEALFVHVCPKDDLGRGNSSLGLESFQGRSSDRIEAEPLVAQELDVCQTVSNYRGRANALEGLGHVQRARSKFAKAEESYVGAFAIYKTIADDLGQGNALLDLGHVQRAQSKHPQAENSFARALAIYERIENDLGRANTFDGFGHIQRARSNYVEAEASFTKAFAIYRSIGNSLGRANALVGLGHVQRERFMHVQAEASFIEALAIYKCIGNERGQANALLGIGYTQEDTGKYVAAEVSYKKALVICEGIEDELGRASALNGLGQVQGNMAKYMEAEVSYTEALAIQRKIGDDLGQANTLGGLGYIQRKLSQDVKAEASFIESLAIYTNVGNDLGRANSSLELARIRLQQNRYAEAKILINAAAKIAEQFSYDWARITSKELLEAVGDMEGSFSQSDTAPPPEATQAEDMNLPRGPK